MKVNPVRNCTSYPLYNHTVPLQSAEERPANQPVHETLVDAPTLTCAQRQGWQLLCPNAFSATWNDGPSAEDIEIHLDEGTGAGFVQSAQGQGQLTFYPGYQFKTAKE